MEAAVDHLQGHTRRFCRSVLGHVAQALLRPPIQAQGNVLGNRIRQAIGRKLDLDSFPFGKLAAVRPQSHSQPKVIEDGRVKLVGYSSNIIRDPGHSVPQGCQIFADFRGGGGALAEPVGVHLEHGQLLIEVVVQLPGDAPPLFLLRGEQTGRQAPQLFPALEQVGFALPQRRLDVLQVLLESGMRREHIPLGQFLRGDVGQRQQKDFPLVLAGIDAAAAHQKNLAPDALEVAFDFQLLESPLFGQSPAQSLPQQRKVPLTVGQLEKRLPFRSLPMKMKRIVERAVSDQYTQGFVEDHQRLGHSLDNRLGEVARLPHLLQTALELVDIIKNHHRPIDLVVLGAVGANAHSKPGALSILNFHLPGRQFLEDSRQQPVQIRDLQIGLDLHDRTADVGGPQIQHTPSHRREMAYVQIVPQHDDGNVDAGEQIVQIIAQPRQLGIPMLQLIVHRG